MRRHLLLFLLGTGIVAALWWHTGWGDLAHLIKGLHPGWLAAALLLVGVQAVLGAVRWRTVAHTVVPLRLGRAWVQVLSVEALNVLVPSRAGDLAKGVFLAREQGGIRTSVGIGLAMIEKWVDTTAFVLLVVVLGLVAPPHDRAGLFLLVVAVAMGVLSLALLLSPAAQWMSRVHVTQSRGLWNRIHRAVGDAGGLIVSFRAARGRIPSLFALSLAMWLLLLLQLSWVLRSLGVEDPGTGLLWSRSALAILVGMLPVTPGGMGTRDAALLYFLGPSIGSTAALGLGAFTAFRYLLLSLSGLVVLPLVGGPPPGDRQSRAGRGA